LPLGNLITDYLPRIAAGSPERGQQRCVAVASTLLASLELSRPGALTLDQQAAIMSAGVYGR
jgi:hypothetical protein